MVWDRGTWALVGDPAEGVTAGKLVFRLHGEKPTRLWELVRTRSRMTNKTSGCCSRSATNRPGHSPSMTSSRRCPSARCRSPWGRLTNAN